MKKHSSKKLPPVYVSDSKKQFRLSWSTRKSLFFSGLSRLFRSVSFRTYSTMEITCDDPLMLKMVTWANEEDLSLNEWFLKALTRGLKKVKETSQGK